MPFQNTMAGLAAGLLFAMPAFAAPPQDPAGIFTFQVENDSVSTTRRAPTRCLTR